MRKRGIRVLPGGDYGFPTSPHGAYAKDLELFVDVLGFSPTETLMAATKHGGEIMGKPGELGITKPRLITAVTKTSSVAGRLSSGSNPPVPSVAFPGAATTRKPS